MSDYLFMLDNHLDAGQNRAVALIQNIAAEAGKNVWLTGGAMRDMLRGAPIRDLDFTVDGDAVALAAKLGTVTFVDPWDRGAEILMADGVHASVYNSRTEKYSVRGEKPVIAPATIHEDLRRRDFTINAIALSLNKGSKGLLIDPTNGQADLASKELRTTNSYVFVDDPVRLIRMLRFQYALEFQLVARTAGQFENALLEDLHKSISAPAVAAELRLAAVASNAAQVVDAMANAGFLQVISPALSGEKRNIAGLEKLERLAQSVLTPYRTDYWIAFVSVMTEKLSTRERADVLRALELTKAEVESFRHMDETVKKLEEELKSQNVKRPSHVYDILQPAPVDPVLLVLYRSGQRVVQDRIRTYFSKYVFVAQEVTDEEVSATGAKPGTAKFERTKKNMITAHLNARPKKIEELPIVPAAPIIPAPMVRGARAR